MERPDLCGTWNDTTVNDDRNEDTRSFDVIRVIDDKAYTRQGVIIPVKDLGTKYERISPEWMDPKLSSEIMAGLPADVRAQMAKHQAERQTKLVQPTIKPKSSPDVGSEIAIGPSSSEAKPTPTPGESLPWFTNAPVAETELEKLIISSMKLGYQKGEKSELPITINLQFDFDIEKIVAGASMMTDASDQDILKALFKFYKVDTETVTNAIIDALMVPDEQEETE